MKRFSVIMAGGGGTRFWPLSRQGKPKQLLNLVGNDAMVNETIRRYKEIIPVANTFVVTSNQQEKLMRDVLNSEVPQENILIEPASRSTAPCILLAALTIMARHGDGVMCVFPSDHYVKYENDFVAILNKAVHYCEAHESLLTIGIKPTYPSTGHGYIKRSDEEENGLYGVLEFVEKPRFETAKKYLESGNYLWNSGIFVWKVSAIIDNFKRFLPRIYAPLKALFENQAGASTLEEVYGAIPNISIDYGIMERSNEVMVIPGEFGWNDIGSWDSLGAIYPPDENGNIVQADHLGIDTRNCIIYGNGRIITSIGLSDMIIVNTDDALLICPKHRSQDVKGVVDLLKQNKRDELL